MAEYPESNLKLRREHRKYFRFPVEGEAVLFLHEPGTRLHCGMVNLGLEGCQLQSPEALAVRVGAEVEVYFRLAGANFRVAGSLQWANDGILGVQFQKMSEERATELADLLGGLREELDARAQEATATKSAAGKKSAGRGKERREHIRHAVEGRAKVRFLSLHSQVSGNIMDVSMGGCRIRTPEALPVGAFRRVEVEFMVNGTPLLLPGVTQALHDRHTVGIRFVEVTERKKEQLRVVMEEVARGVAV